MNDASNLHMVYVRLQAAAVTAVQLYADAADGGDGVCAAAMTAVHA